MHTSLLKGHNSEFFDWFLFDLKVERNININSKKKRLKYYFASIFIVIYDGYLYAFMFRRDFIFYTVCSNQIIGFRKVK